jgi:calcineurin-like phosphoesterase family protein
MKIFKITFKDGPTLYFSNFPKKHDVIPHVKNRFAQMVNDASWPVYHRHGKRTLLNGMIEIDSGELINNDKIGQFTHKI